MDSRSGRNGAELRHGSLNSIGDTEQSYGGLFHESKGAVFGVRLAILLDRQQRGNMNH